MAAEDHQASSCSRLKHKATDAWWTVLTSEAHSSTSSRVLFILQQEAGAVFSDSTASEYFGIWPQLVQHMQGKCWDNQTLQSCKDGITVTEVSHNE